MYKIKKIFLNFFGHAWTKCRLVTKHVLSSTNFPSCLFTYALKYLYKKFKLSNKDNLLLIYTFIGMIIFCRSIHLCFQSHQICTFSAGLGRTLTFIYHRYQRAVYTSCPLLSYPLFSSFSFEFGFYSLFFLFSLITAVWEWVLTRTKNSYTDQKFVHGKKFRTRPKKFVQASQAGKGKSRI